MFKRSHQAPAQQLYTETNIMVPIYIDDSVKSNDHSKNDQIRNV